jgi:hypothetical protein
VAADMAERHRLECFAVADGHCFSHSSQRDLLE